MLDAVMGGDKNIFWKGGVYMRLTIRVESEGVGHKTGYIRAYFIPLGTKRTRILYTE